MLVPAICVLQTHFTKCNQIEGENAHTHILHVHILLQNREPSEFTMLSLNDRLASISLA